MNLATSRELRSDTERLSELVSRVDLVHLVETYAGPGRRVGTVTKYRCPHPSHPDRHPSFDVTLSKSGRQVAICRSTCGFYGDALELVKWLEGWSTAEAARWIRDQYGTARPAPKPKVAAPPAPQLTVLTETPAERSEAAARFLAKYLEWRGWPESVPERFGLSVVRDSSGTLRVRHPYYAPDAAGEWRCVYWQDRGPLTAEPKWLSAKGATPTLYNLRSLEADSLTAVVLCEGPADAITAELLLEVEPAVPGVAVVGIPGTGAWRSEWAELFTGLRVILATDTDTAGEGLAARIVADIHRTAARLTLPANDLTDSVREAGPSEMRGELVAALRSLPVEVPAEMRAGVDLLLEAFPGARVAGGEM
jgi:hypothetical protein